MLKSLITAILLLASSLEVAIANNPKSCADIFGEVESTISSLSEFELDYGPGLYVNRLSAQSYHVGPPPSTFTSIHDARSFVLQNAQESTGQSFTVIFRNFSENQVLDFRRMLARDQTFRQDKLLSAILLEDLSSDASRTDYAGDRVAAQRARDLLLRRYAWSEAKVEAAPKSGDARETYTITVMTDTPELFSLRLRLRAARFFRNRTEEIQKILGSQAVDNSTPEQAAHELIKELRKHDPGVRDGTLKIIAGDFIIAKVDNKNEPL